MSESRGIEWRQPSPVKPGICGAAASNRRVGRFLVTGRSHESGEQPGRSHRTRAGGSSGVCGASAERLADASTTRQGRDFRVFLGVRRLSEVSSGQVSNTNFVLARRLHSATIAASTILAPTCASPFTLLSALARLVPEFEDRCSRLSSTRS